MEVTDLVLLSMNGRWAVGVYNKSGEPRPFWPGSNELNYQNSKQKQQHLSSFANPLWRNVTVRLMTACLRFIHPCRASGRQQRCWPAGIWHSPQNYQEHQVLMVFINIECFPLIGQFYCAIMYYLSWQIKSFLLVVTFSKSVSSTNHLMHIFR